ncbi:unnamed protein product [Staurois parvus]|uniref:Uncharacterized protein n=1 Tax=Staurois parvus TaxID=386267 RepID=A0ABN9HD20_9NEOB|nr:unnamed protein product [Staurois parvus]
MTRDSGHSTDDQRLWTVQGLTKRLRRVQEMTRDCGEYKR